MTKLDLLTQIGTRSHLAPYASYSTKIADAFREAINEQSLIAPLSDVQYLVKDVVLGVNGSSISLPLDFSKLIKMEISGASTSTKRRFALVDLETWKWLGVDDDFEPPPKVTYYFVNGSNVLFYPNSGLSGADIYFSYLSCAYPDDWEDDFELTKLANRFTEKFITIVKNRAVEILTAEMRGEQQ